MSLSILCTPETSGGYFFFAVGCSIETVLGTIRFRVSLPESALRSARSGTLLFQVICVSFTASGTLPFQVLRVSFTVTGAFLLALKIISLGAKRVRGVRLAQIEGELYQREGLSSGWIG